MNKSQERIEFLIDVFTCIVEDFGYNSWRQIESYDPDLSIATIVVADEYEDDAEIFYINLQTVTKGIARVTEVRFNMNSEMKQNIKVADVTNEAGDIDVYDADAILQAAIFGELVYG